MITLRALPPKSYAVRVYAVDKSPDNGDAYKAIAVIRIRGSVARIGPALGDLGVRDLRDICNRLQLLGVQHLRLRRALPHRFPTAKAVRVVGRYTLFQIDMA